MPRQQQPEDPRWAEMLSLISGILIAKHPEPGHTIRAWCTTRDLKFSVRFDATIPHGPGGIEVAIPLAKVRERMRTGATAAELAVSLTSVFRGVGPEGEGD